MAVHRRSINRYSVISFSIRSLDSQNDYSGGVKFFDCQGVVKFFDSFDYPFVVTFSDYTVSVKQLDSPVEVQINQVNGYEQCYFAAG